MNNPNLAHPKSLEELEKFFVDNNIPQEKVRFFINEDMKEAKCFGVYIDPETFEYVVYKNKSDGSRFERYRGNNEQEAVNIFFNKFRDEFNKQDLPLKRKTVTYKSRKPISGLKIYAITALVFTGLSTLAIFGYNPIRKLFNIPRSGYYMINDEPYYYRKHHWWAYDYDDNDWYIYDGINYTSSLYYDDYLGGYYSGDYDFEDIRDDSQYYDYYSESDDDSSSDSYDSDDYDYDSWDSDTTDWDSDW